MPDTDVYKRQKQIKETVGASVRIELDTNNQANYGSAEDFGNGEMCIRDRV